MPAGITHLIVQQRLPAYLRELGGEKGREYADLLDADPCSPYAGFGSMGPDFLFFSLKEYGTPLDELTNFLFDVYDALEPLISFYEDNIEPVVDKIEDAIATLDQALFQGLFGQIKDTADLLSNTALNTAAVVVTGNADLFYPFYPKIQQGKPEDEWYWFDFLHYRRTGQFASQMWRMAGSDYDLKRYVLGYSSHIGTDVVGHPFVNAVTGGPYRTHWHRHKLVENWIDAYARNYYPDDKKTLKCLKLSAKDTYIPNSISGSYYYRLTEFNGGRLPEPLANLLSKAMQSTYQNIPHPGFLSASDLDSTYRLWLLWFKRVTQIGDAQKPAPVPPPGSATVSLVSDYVNGMPSFPGGSGSPSGGFSVFGIFAAIAAFVKWLVDTLIYTLEWIITHAVDILALPFTEAIALLKWLIYQVQKGVWEIYDNLRFMLVLGGYLFPEQRDLAKFPWGLAFINTSFANLTGGPTPNFLNYPRKQESHGIGGPMEHHLFYPGVIQEMLHAEPAPQPFFGVNPEAFISQGHGYDPSIEDLYQCVEPYGPDRRYTHFVDSNSWHTGQLGSALWFCARLISRRLDKLPNFNLDGDRGYGWKTWRARDPKNIENINPVDVDYIDP
jgi:hypothetical protein